MRCGRRWGTPIPSVAFTPGVDTISRSFLNQPLQGEHSEFSRLASMLETLSAIAVLIACLGLFALSAFIAERRRKEIGVSNAIPGDLRRPQ
jgi:putative ABC transport system permease protein